MGLQFDNKISTGHLLTAGAMVVAAITAYADLRSRQTQLVLDMAEIRTEAQARETRVRAVEIAQASQASDLRSIQAGIGRIEKQLEKFQPMPR